MQTRYSPRNEKKPPHRTGRPARWQSALQRLLIGAGIIWAFPITVFGLILALPAMLPRHGRIIHLRHATTPALLVTGTFADRLLAMHPLGNIIGMSIGHVVIVREAHLTYRLLEHELAHVRQAARWGLLFPFAYLMSSLHQACRGRRAYRDNLFEVQARAAESAASHARFNADGDGPGKV